MHLGNVLNLLQTRMQNNLFSWKESSDFCQKEAGGQLPHFTDITQVKELIAILKLSQHVPLTEGIFIGLSVGPNNQVNICNFFQLSKKKKVLETTPKVWMPCNLNFSFCLCNILKAWKMPDHSNTWGHQMLIIWQKTIGKMPNHERDTSKRQCILQMLSCNLRLGQKKDKDSAVSAKYWAPCRLSEPEFLP